MADDTRNKILDAMVRKVAFAVLRESQRATPVRTGTLRRSETTRVEYGAFRTPRAFIGSNVVYAPFVHKRVPFFEMGMQAAQPAVESVVREAGEQLAAAAAHELAAAITKGQKLAQGVGFRAVRLPAPPTIELPKLPEPPSLSIPKPARILRRAVRQVVRKRK